jgi:PKD repeat protein
MTPSPEFRPPCRRAMRALMAALTAFTLSCLCAPGALGQDTQPDFTWSPMSPMACQQVTFTPTNLSPGETVTWDYENDSTFVSDSTHTFVAEGSYPVTMKPPTGPTATHDVVVQNAPPVASFVYSPAKPDPGEPITFTSTSTDCDDPALSYEWDFGDGSPPSSVQNPIHSFATAGRYDITLTVKDTNGATDLETKALDVGPFPTAAFHRYPPESVLLETGQPATFTSDSTASFSNSITSLTWDIDGDGFDDGTGAVLTHTFITPGTKVVRLRVEQTNGATDVAESTFRVNAPPVPGFVWAPGSPVAGASVQLYSTSVDAEGALPDRSQAWELDGDGDFDDAFGPSVARAFTAGNHDVSLRVTDGDGATRTITRRITVAASSTTAAGPALMKPFPTVRLVGFVVPSGARINLVEVRGAPRGARVTVRCTGEGCPFRLRRRVAETGRVRLSSFARVLQAGTRLQVFVRAPRVIGKYAAFRIRAGKRPLRVDRCLMPGAAKPTPCT